MADEIIDEEDIIAEEREPSFRQANDDDFRVTDELPYDKRMTEQP